MGTTRRDDKQEDDVSECWLLPVAASRNEIIRVREMETGEETMKVNKIQVIKEDNISVPEGEWIDLPLRVTDSRTGEVTIHRGKFTTPEGMGLSFEGVDVLGDEPMAVGTLSPWIDEVEDDLTAEDTLIPKVEEHCKKVVNDHEVAWGNVHKEDTLIPPTMAEKFQASDEGWDILPTHEEGVKRPVQVLRVMDAEEEQCAWKKIEDNLDKIKENEKERGDYEWTPAMKYLFGKRRG